MRKLIIFTAGIFLILDVSAQQLAKKKNYKSQISVGVMSNEKFQSYVFDVQQIMSDNDKMLSDIRFNIFNMKSNVSRKVASKLKSLQIENKELKTDLNNYVNYGIGDWRIFVKEFNEDLSLFSEDIRYMNYKFGLQELIAQTPR